MPAKPSDRPRIFINNVHLKGYKSIEDLTIDFQKGLNILIGKNGSGKSNFMEFMFQTIRSAPNSEIFYKYAKLEFLAEDDHLFVVEFEKELLNNRKNDPDERIKTIEKFSIDGKIVFDRPDNEDFKKNFEFKNKKYIYWTQRSLRSLFSRLGYKPIYPLYIRFNLPDSLECVSIPGTLKLDNESSIYFSGNYSNYLGFIGDVYFSIETLYDNELSKIKTITKANILEKLKVQNEIIEKLTLYTTIQDVRFNTNINLYRDEKSFVIDNIKLEFKLNGNWMPWSQLSDGTKRLFYIIAEITNTNGLVLIEEPELGIHPHQFILLMDFLKEQSESKQIIISTHSPKALDHLSQDELNNILITYYDPRKGTQIRHLSNNEVKKAKKYMKEVGFFSDYWMLSDLE